MTPTPFRYSVTYDYPSPGTTRIEVRVVGGTPEENDAEAQRVGRMIEAAHEADAMPSGLVGTMVGAK